MFVADASVVMQWVLPGEMSATSQRALALAAKAPIVVPALWLWETQNVVLTLTRQKIIKPAKAKELRVELGLLSRRVDSAPDRQTIDRIWEIATRHMATFYDASYIELAERLGLPLASNDGGIRQAARRVGVELI